MDQPTDPTRLTQPTPARVGDFTGERPGDFIGSYKLLEIIGEGGFGTVWLAERREPMVQRAALKIIKPGMDSKAVIARFEQERQALAVMDHPHVARVFDGGVTGRGLPYFVMEYVQGAPITEYCDRHRLTLFDRLELFIPVCEAVQHAHHKGLIHRDLKPSNVLVTEIEGKPVPKVIDFGVAKAITHEDWANTAFTQEGMVIGTPEYMSPEQVSGQVDIDTRTDVYSLGVLLYELLTGELPFDSRELRRAGIEEIKRLIREITPPKPSTRLMQLAGDRTAIIARARSSTGERIASELRRELEWIPLMALRKERERRYASPQALADDLQRYLDGRALRAAPDSRIYLARKFVRRNGVAVGATAAVFVALGAGLTVAVWQAREAARQAVRADERAEAATKAEAAATAARDAEKVRADELKQVSEFQSKMLGDIDTTKAGIELMADVRERFVAALEKAGVQDDERTARVDALRQELVRVNATDAAAAMIDRTILRPAVMAINEQFKDQPLVDAQLRQAMADLYRAIGLYDAALPLQESALATRRRLLGEEHPETLASIKNMGSLLRVQGKLAEAEPFSREALGKRRRVLGEEHPDTISSISNMGVLLQFQGKLGEAEQYFREALEKSRRALGEEHPSTLTCIHNMGWLLQAQGKLADAEPYSREALEKSRRVHGEEHSITITCLTQLGGVLQAQGKLDGAELYLREALEKSRRVRGEEHPRTLTCLTHLGILLQAQGQLVDAERHYREALEKCRRVLGEEHPETLTSIGNMGFLFQAQGNLADAERYSREALEIRRRVLGEEHPETLISISNMAVLLQSQGKLAEAESYSREALEKSRRVRGEEHPNTLAYIHNLGSLLRVQGKFAEAEPFCREAMEKSRRLSGEDHPTTLVFVGNMGGLLRDMDRHQEAIDLLTPAEPAARKAFTGGNALRLAGFLTALGSARVGLGYDAERFALAEANLLEAHPIFLKARGESHDDTLGCVQGLVALYTAWDAAEPGNGYDAKAAEWKARLDASRPVAPKDPAAEEK